jgi:hypothetical protein
MLAEFIAEIRATQTDTDLLIMADWMEERGQRLDSVLKKVTSDRLMQMLGADAKLTVNVPGSASVRGGRMVCERVIVRSFGTGEIIVDAAYVYDDRLTLLEDLERRQAGITIR